MGCQLANCAGISTNLLAEPESDRTTLEIPSQEGHRHALLFNEGENPRSDHGFLRKYQEIPCRVADASEAELLRGLTFRIPLNTEYNIIHRIMKFPSPILAKSTVISVVALLWILLYVGCDRPQNRSPERITVPGTVMQRMPSDTLGVASTIQDNAYVLGSGTGIGERRLRRILMPIGGINWTERYWNAGEHNWSGNVLGTEIRIFTHGDSTNYNNITFDFENNPSGQIPFRGGLSNWTKLVSCLGKEFEDFVNPIIGREWPKNYQTMVISTYIDGNRVELVYSNSSLQLEIIANDEVLGK